MKGCIPICTAISYLTNDHYFGRNLDLDHRYNECVVVIPRNFPLQFRQKGIVTNHYAMIGMATIADEYPLFYDATNERGLSIAGLNFPGNAKYHPITENKNNIASFELVSWLLCQCATVEQAIKLLQNTNIADITFSDQYPTSPLHWMLSDKKQSIVIESTIDGLQLYENPVGVLTNNPTFPYQLYNLNQYVNLSRQTPENRFSDQIGLKPDSLGMGAIGLPGDLSSVSRFVRATFTKLNSICTGDENESISQFFHILESVAQTNGCCQTKKGFEKTIYTSCCNTDKGIYYYTTYDNHQISAVNMFRQDLQCASLYQFPLITRQNIAFVN